MERMKVELSLLRHNSRSKISGLTRIAKDFVFQASGIAGVIEGHIAEANAERALLLLYVVDSVVKDSDIKSVYVPLLAPLIVSKFSEIFRKGDTRIREKLWRLRQTWKTVFCRVDLNLVDQRCHAIDTNWPFGGKSGLPKRPRYDVRETVRGLVSEGRTITSQSMEVLIRSAEEEHRKGTLNGDEYLELMNQIAQLGKTSIEKQRAAESEQPPALGETKEEHMRSADKQSCSRIVIRGVFR